MVVHVFIFRIVVMADQKYRPDPKMGKIACSSSGMMSAMSDSLVSLNTQTRCLQMRTTENENGKIGMEKSK